MSVSREELTEIVDRSLGLHFEVDGKFEWVDRTTRTQSYEWQVRPHQPDRASVGGECYLTFQKENGRTTVDLRTTIEFRDIDQLRNQDLLARARAHMETAYVEYRIVEEFSDGRQSFHVFIGTALFFDPDHLHSLETVADEVDVHLEVLAELAAEVDGLVYLESTGPRPQD